MTTICPSGGTNTEEETCVITHVSSNTAEQRCCASMIWSSLEPHGEDIYKVDVPGYGVRHCMRVGVENARPANTTTITMVLGQGCVVVQRRLCASDGRERLCFAYERRCHTSRIGMLQL